MNENLKQNIRKFMPAIIAIIIILIFIIIATLFSNSGRSNFNKYIALTLEKNAPIPIEKGKLYGYISANDGKELIPAKYTNAKPFYGNYAIVENLENKVTSYIIIDKNGKEKISSTKPITYVIDYGLYIIDNCLYNENLKKLSDKDMIVTYKDYGFSSYTKNNENGKPIESGILNSSGKTIYSYKFNDEDSKFSFTISNCDKSINEQYAKITINNNKFAIINLNNGKIVYDFTENSIIVDDNNVFKILSNQTNTSICILKNKIAYSTNDDVNISYYDLSKKIIQIYNKNSDYTNRYSYYDLNKNKLLDKKPEKSSSNSTLSSLTGYNSITSNNKHGIAKNEKTILTCEYDDIQFLPFNIFNYIKTEKNQELAITKLNNIYSIINLKNKKNIISFNSFGIDTYSSSTFIKAPIIDTKEICVYNLLTGKQLNFDANSQIIVHPNYIIVINENNKTYYNCNLKAIYTINTGSESNSET